tara:strand:- start:376 stop:495 length:120 start_codon:yes stop_codon:yes gene_type:complete
MVDIIPVTTVIVFAMYLYNERLYSYSLLIMVEERDIHLY